MQPRSRRQLPLLVTTLLMMLVFSSSTAPTTAVAAADTKPARRFDPSAPPPNPNPPSAAVVKERNARRFPGEWFPEGYDVGEPATSGTASSSTLWQSPLGVLAASESRVWFDHPVVGAPRGPGRLLLNMLVRNEAANLARTLPAWARVIDYWIIGVDEANDDDSVAIIQRVLGHLPGEIALVRGFDGHGPTWTTLVDLGIAHYPGATHGIIADADFAPMRSTFDRMELDIRCSKHMYTIWTEDHRNERKMDWVYRNIPGARITRRTHQVVEVPQLPDQEVFQTLLNLPLDERAGGFGDRSGNKQERYIAWMAADLLDFPDDPRALYYLGYGHLDLYNTHGGNPTPKHLQALSSAVTYFDRRVDLPPEVGNKEERWFALLKLAEIHERYIPNSWGKAEVYYNRCIALDEVRADPWFYLGQHYRLTGDYHRAEPLLHRAATLTPPVRSLFMWYHLYYCLSKLEYGRNFLRMSASPSSSSDVSIRLTKRAINVLTAADCSAGDPGNEQEVRDILTKARDTLSKLRQRNEAAKAAKRKLAADKAAAAAEAEAAAAKAKAEAEAKADTESDEKEEESAGEDADNEVEAIFIVDDDVAAVPRPLQQRTPAEFVEAGQARLDALRSAMQVGFECARLLEQQARACIQRSSSSSSSGCHHAESATRLHESLVGSLRDLSSYLASYDELRGGAKSKLLRQRADLLACANIRRASNAFIATAEQREQIQTVFANDSLLERWTTHAQQLRRLCR